jgi:transposase, IS30 family
MAYIQLTRDETVLLAAYRRDGLSFGAIAAKLGRSKSTLSREWKRNTCDGIGYHPEFAAYHRSRRRAEANQQRRTITAGSTLERFIFDRLRDRWSPEDIAAILRAAREAGEMTVTDVRSGTVYDFGIIPSLSAKTIYAFIRREHPAFLQYFSVLSHKKPRPKGAGKRELIKGRTWIEDRPKEAEERKAVGHWEGDTIVSGCRNRAIATLADRATGYLLAGLMADRTAGELNRAMHAQMTSLPLHVRKTATMDNGPEFAEHAALAVALALAIYFAHPYHSWERPVNERMNRELRRFFPKGTHFAEIEEWELDRAVSLINHKPRKRLGYRTPHAVFHEQCQESMGVAL